MADHRAYIEEGASKNRPIITIEREYDKSVKSIRLEGGHLRLYENGEYKGTIGFAKAFRLLAHEANCGR